jgi:transcriptional regulator with XRE-family HTH domain
MSTKGRDLVSGQPSAEGHIGRRMLLRREQLGLSREQVAERAGVAPSYLQYVEEQPAAFPGLTFLLRVADAMDTTLSQLRGGEPRSGIGKASAHPVFTELDPAECRTLLYDHGVGRVAVAGPAGPAILPVNYDVVDGAVVFRTAPGSAPSLAAGAEAAFEVDQIDEALGRGWSVLVVGPATEVTDATTVHRLDARAHTGPWAGGERAVWVRVEPARVTGRRITSR